MSPIDSLASSNPYSGANSIYRESPWQSFLRTVGFRTGNDAWRENMKIQENEYNAALAQKAYDEEYNLPVNQVARMRAAGINPDLDGGKSIDSGAAQPLGEDPSTPMQSTGDEQAIGTFVNGVMSVFTTGLGIVQSFQGIARNRLENVLLGVQGDQAFKDYAEGMAFKFLPKTPDSVIDEDSGAEHTWLEQAYNAASMFAGKNLPKKSRDKFLSHVQAFWNGAPGDAEAYNTWYSNQEARFNYGVHRGAYGDLTIDDVLYGITKPIGERVLKILETGQNAEISGNEAESAENAYRKTYAENLDPLLAAEATKSGQNANIASNKVQETLRGAMVDILHFLTDASEKKGVGAGLAKVALALLSMGSLNLLPSLPNFSFGSSSGMSPKGPTSSSKFSIGF